MHQRAKRAALYARTATAQEAGTTHAVAEQLHQCKEYCVRNGYSLVSVYEEEGSGNREDRKMLATALRDAQEGKFDVLVIADVSRLARKPYLFAALVQQFEAVAVTIESVAEDAANSQILALLYTETARIQRERNAARSRAARQHRPDHASHPQDADPVARRFTHQQ